MVSLYFCFVFYVLCFMLNSFRDVGMNAEISIPQNNQLVNLLTRQLVNSTERSQS